MSLLVVFYDWIPRRVRKLLRNSVTLWLRRYLVLRPKCLSTTPREVSIELTDKCNLRCSYCPKSVGIGIDGGNMDFDLFKKVVDEMFSFQTVEQVLLGGFGEPLLYPHLEEALHYVRSRKADVHIATITNGTLLSEKWAFRLIEAQLNKITISLNATSSEQYREINHSDQYERIVENTRVFLTAVNKSGADMRILIQALEGPSGAEEISRFRKEWAPYLGRCGDIQVQPFVNWAGQIDTAKIVRKNDVQRKRHHEQYPCAHLRGWLITREGNGLGCCMVLPADSGDLLLGNIRDMSIREMFMGTRFAKLRQMNVTDGLQSLRPCNQCNAYLSVPNVWFRNPFHRFLGPRWL